MNTGIEELLKDGIDRLTAGTKAPAGLAARVRKRHGRRRLAIHAIAAAGAAAASAIAVAVATGGSGGALPQHHGVSGAQPQHAAPGVSRVTGTQARTVADVIERAQRALSRRDLIMETTSSSGRVYFLDGSGKHQKILAMKSVSWSYRNITRDELRTIPRSGHRQGPVRLETEYLQGRLLPGNRTQFTLITVDFGKKTWSRRLEQLPAGPAPIKLGCNLRHYLSKSLAPDETYLSTAPSSIRAALACGGLRISGHGQVNGVAVIKMTGTPRLSKYPLTVDVSPATYLPVRLKFGNLWWNYRWLAPTAANLASLTVHAPAGFQRVAGG